MPDPIISAVRPLLEDAFDVLRRTVDDLPPEALDWEPAGPDTNSIAVLATHAVNATRLLLSLAMGLPQPERDRPAEFATSGRTASDLTELIDQFAADCHAILDGAPDQVDWSTPRSMVRANGSTWDQSAAYFIAHALDHLRGHADEAALTRHVWAARA